ncbi:CamS family sex pheromone protein [Alkalicoccus urumqiensis]|uniref:CamS family sex pheromone protein n=1 Tax=Alkalicoccus urumqiensis TaxID=1548213 RepID=A0A2P6MIW9_ALKUR|nr:CamS family sex pheromone protein [Alkalicoccus urumqiensis]PRO66228.1 hypothetical protein C6I21_05340 [Alkalicoccus urumqiensis]
MSKKWMAAGAASFLFLTGCMPSVEQPEEEVIVVEETEEEEEQEYVITPTISTPDNYYRNVLEDGTYVRSEARGTTADAMQNRRDMEEFELGMMEIASSRFDQENYYFQEGNFLDGEEVNSWLRRFQPEQVNEEGEVTSEATPGLNPQLADAEDEEASMRQAPLVLSNVQEHNYFLGNDEEGVQLGGVVMGISVRSVYYFRTEDEDGGLYFHEEPVEEEYALEYAREQAGVMLQRLRSREGLETVPVTFAIFREEPRGSVVPGTFEQVAHVDEGDMNIQGWETLNEQNFVFPSSQARDAQPALSEAYSQFQSEVTDFFGQSVSLVGRGQYQDGTLDQMTVNVRMQTPGRPEVVAIAQFISGRLSSTFQTQAPVYVYLESVNGPEGVVVQYPGEEAFMHIYR